MWKLAFKHYGNHAFANTLLMLQMIIMYLAAIAMTSGIVSRYQEYLPLREIITQDSDYYFFLTSFTGMDEIKAELKGDVNLLGCYRVGLGIQQNGKYNDQIITPVSYDDVWLEIYKPELESGVWFDAKQSDEDFIPVVISQNELGYAVGDFITFLDGEQKYEAVVIGMLKDGARIVTAEPPQSTASYSVHHMYQSYYSTVEEKMLILMPEKILAEKRGVSSWPNGQLIVQYPNGISAEDRKSNDNFLKKAGMINFACSIDAINQNSLSYIYESVKLLLPIAIAVLILVMTSVISMSALFTKQHLRNYSIYYICGLKWKRCVLINFYSALLTASGALFVTFLGVACFQPALAQTVVSLGGWQLLICTLLTVFYLLISVILPIQIVYGQTPKDILRSN